MRRRRFIRHLMAGAAGFLLFGGRMLRRPVRSWRAGGTSHFVGRLRPLNHERIARPARWE